MLRDISTRRKLLILCTAFAVAIAVAIYISVAEKQIAIDFATKELGGVHHIQQFEEVYSALLPDPRKHSAPSKFLEAATNARADPKASQDLLRTAALEESLARMLQRLWSGKVEGAAERRLVAETLGKTQELIARIGDESNLALDPELDSYYLQDILVRQTPKLLSQLGDVWSLANNSEPAATPGDETRLLTRAAIARSTAEELARSLTSAYRGNETGTLRQRNEAMMAVMLSSVTAYLGAVDESLAKPDSFDRASLEPLWKSAVDDALAAWGSGLPDLAGLLNQRIDDLTRRLYWSLVIMGGLAALSLLLAVIIHRQIVHPLARLEEVANRVRQTKDYSHRVDDEAKDEIGHLAGAFNEMLGELDQARSRELADRAEQAARQRLSVLLNASPAVIYCREASGDYQPTFVSDSVTRLFVCTTSEYLDNTYLWRDRVHRDDITRINTWVDQ
ncbi:MAG: HAMP domain-containing protein, partial [Methyloceanibacter sp.]